MKNKKEIQLATKDFLKVFRERKASELENATFIPYNPIIQYDNQKWALVGGITSVLIFIYLGYNALIVDSIYYWHVDLPVMVGVLIIAIFSVLTLFFTKRYFVLDKILKDYINRPEESQYGVLLTDDYFFELTPEVYHIIAKENIIRLDYEEQKSENENYLEFLVESNEVIEARGILYNPNDFDLKKWFQS